VNILGGDSVSHCEKKGSYEHAFNSEWSFVCEGWMKNEIDEREVDAPMNW
jgi:hypothetical protein